MKISVDLNLDWIEEGGSVDETVKEMIIDKVVQDTRKNISDKIMEQATESIMVKVDALVEELWSDFMDKRVKITDKYGDPIEHHDSIKSMLKTKLDTFLDSKVTANGTPVKPGECGYNTRPRIEWLLDSRIAEHTKGFVDKVQKDFDAKLKVALNAKLQESMASAMLKNIDMSKILSNIKD